MYKDYNLTQHTLPMETSVLIPSNDMSRHVNEIVETISEIVIDTFKHHRGATHIIQNVYICALVQVKPVTH